MNRQRVYVDTSVIGGCLDAEFARESCALLDMARRGEITLLILYIMLDELRRGPVEVNEILDSIPEQNAQMLSSSLDAFDLRDHYLAERIVGQSSSDDALHVALASVAGADLLVSWNFRHIVHYDKIRQFNGVNLVKGYPMIDIRSPLEVV